MIYDSDYKLKGLVFGKDGCFFRVLYEDGVIDPAADPGKYDVKVLAAFEATRDLVPGTIHGGNDEDR